MTEQLALGSTWRHNKDLEVHKKMCVRCEADGVGARAGWGMAICERQLMCEVLWPAVSVGRRTASDRGHLAPLQINTVQATLVYGPSLVRVGRRGGASTLLLLLSSHNK